MRECPVCQHPKIDAINAALDSGRSPNLVRAQYRLERHMLEAHIVHRQPSIGKRRRVIDRNHLPIKPSGISLGVRFTSGQVVPPMPDVDHLLDKPLRDLRQITENPLAQLKQAWRLAKDDPEMRRNMVLYIQEQLREEDMGLP